MNLDRGRGCVSTVYLCVYACLRVCVIRWRGRGGEVQQLATHSGASTTPPCSLSVCYPSCLFLLCNNILPLGSSRYLWYLLTICLHMYMEYGERN
ncbi:hypothetical protein BU24DRAFT_28492 [Aaosphaeria arxii CBS 175.79]|uniref:Uncharacterized protein n=1 Tax=Aaosphaeria arxii CBS 175.79 TaxID=1450172 RepID=A0A6A5YAL8_9PLEO|nr:uncharacterized protein BU24DRAFT_28492 [Aaosphaeria arxii CBS 175.79]KAF2021771.1 hypothetical protein BU24DRAFT_28492 [Aaosphaeria arxii CBS 175.79]